MSIPFDPIPFDPLRKTNGVERNYGLNAVFPPVRSQVLRSNGVERGRTGSNGVTPPPPMADRDRQKPIQNRAMRKTNSTTNGPPSCLATVSKFRTCTMSI